MKNIKKFKSFINELRTDTYANFMDTTDDHGWTSFLNDKVKGEKEGRVNKLARHRFTEEFNKEFPLESTTINTDKGTYNFDGIKFNANYTTYDLIFKFTENNWDNFLWIKPDSNTEKGYWIDYKKEDVLDSESEELVKQMLRYNTVFKQGQHR